MAGSVLAQIDANMVDSGTIVRSGIKEDQIAREHPRRILHQNARSTGVHRGGSARKTDPVRGQDHRIAEPMPVDHTNESGAVNGPDLRHLWAVGHPVVDRCDAEEVIPVGPLLTQAIHDGTVGRVGCKQ